MVTDGAETNIYFDTRPRQQKAKKRNLLALLIFVVMNDQSGDSKMGLSPPWRSSGRCCGLLGSILRWVSITTSKSCDTGAPACTPSSHNGSEALGNKMRVDFVEMVSAEKVAVCRNVFVNRR